MARVDILGDIVDNEDAMIYDYFGWDSTSPRKVKEAINAAGKDELIDVYINSPGGYVDAGQEIYSALRSDSRTRIHITGMACSAASIIAMAGPSDMSPVAMLMIHNVQGCCDGDYHDLKHEADVLKNMNSALAAAYAEKTGKAEDEILGLMDKETWLTANQCIEMGFIDSITPTAQEKATASTGIRLTDEMRQKYAQAKKAEKEQAEQAAKLVEDLDSFGI